ncbi:MAG: chaperonin GroEL, partial [Phycisphaerales bacterium]|nr:chaperonin GroEL [Phycisphaerales bacterium]
MAKQMLYSTDAKAAMLSGVSQLASAVKVTLGPTGRNVLLEKPFGGPKVTKDGVSVSKEVDLLDPFANMGAKMANQVASKTADKAGDGTTTAVVLAEAIVKEGLKFVAAGANTIALKRGIDQGTKAAIATIASLAKKVKGTSDLQSVATVSANWDTQIGEIIASAFDAVGTDGVITVEEGKSLQCEKEVVEGMQFDKGYLSPYFMTNATTLECVLEDAYVLVCDSKISSLRDLVGILEKTAASGKGLLLIAEDIDGDALAGLVVNRLRAGLKVCAVKAPAFGDRRKQILGDIATVVGATVVSEEAGMKLEDLTVEQLGSARQMLISKDATTIVEGGGTKKAIASRVEQIRKQIETTTSDYDREKLSERLAKLAGGVAIIRAGAATETEMKERKDLID